MTTIGAMRSALYYYELVPLLIEYSNEVSAVAVETAEKADTFRVELARETTEKKQWRRWTIIAVAGDIILIGLIGYIAAN